MNRQQRRQSRRQEQGGDPEAEDAVGASGLEVDVPLADDGVPLAEETFAAESEGAESRSGGRETLAPRRYTGPRQFLHEVNVELRKVAWPSRAETLNYSTVVLITLAVLMALIFGLDDAFSRVANFLFNP